MPRILYFILIAVCWSAHAPAEAAAQEQADGEPPQVLVLGSFHFKGSTQDAVSVTMGDILAPKRQAEIAEVLSRLERFAPTKIAVELTPEHESKFNEDYRAYLKGNYTLSANEREQLGMRLAKRMGHERLYAVDFAQGMDFDRVMAAAEAAGQSQLQARFFEEIGRIEKWLEDAQTEDATILDALRFHNGPLLEKGNAIYMLMSVLGSQEDPAGAEVVGGWYTRNLKIYANVMRLIEGPEERVLVIYGSGHGPHLTDFFDQNPDVKSVPALSILGAEE